jgi:hypothetical protein
VLTKPLKNSGMVRSKAQDHIEVSSHSTESTLQLFMLFYPFHSRAFVQINVVKDPDPLIHVCIEHIFIHQSINLLEFL